MNVDESSHRWEVSIDEAESIQTQLAQSVIRDDRIGNVIRHVAGVDVAYAEHGVGRVYAGVVVLDCESQRTVETQTAVGETRFPYVPGLFAFRELPHLLEAFEKVENAPDLVICDGQGIAHPRRCGLASHLGVLLDIPAIGCGKTRHIGEYEEPGPTRGSRSELRDGDEVIGSVLRTQDTVKPLFVSVGHRVSLDTATSWILRLASQYRQPEPIRRANQLVNTLRASGLT